MDFGLCIRISNDPSKWIYQNRVNPTRLPNDDFTIIRTLDGHALTRGTNQPAINDPRIYGKFTFLTIKHLVVQLFLFQNQLFFTQ